MSDVETPVDEATAATFAASDPALAATEALTLATPAGNPGPVTHEGPARYRRGEELGRGGMGRVVVAHDTDLGRDIAMKELLTRGSGDGVSVGAVARFLSEARVTGQLEHPSIVPVYELGRAADGSLYYTMKRIRGRSLGSHLADARTLEARLLLIGAFRDICQALAYAHSRGVVHRDLKPDNVMIGEFGETLVVDWGIAKVHGRDDPRAGDVRRRVEPSGSAQTIDGSAVGTPAYMSPEQARGDLPAIDERSDVWGLGAILFEILTGRPPFVGTTAMGILSQVLTDPPPRVRALAPDAPPELAAIVDRALRPDRSERYASAQELERDVAAWQDGRIVGAYRYSSWELVRRFVRRNRAATLAAGAIFAAVLVASGLVYRSYLDEQAAHGTAERRATEATQERERAEANEREARIALAAALLQRAERAIEDGDAIGAAVFAAGSIAHDPVDLSDGPPASLDEEALAARERRDRAFSLYLDAEAARGWAFERRMRIETTRPPAISPSGGRVAREHGSMVVVTDLETGDSHETAIRTVEQVLAFTDEDHVVVSGEASGVYDLASGAMVFETLPGTSASVVGNALAVLTPLGVVARYDVARGVEDARIEVAARGRRSGVSLSPDARRLATWDSANEFVETHEFDGAAAAPLRVATGGWTRTVCFSPDGLAIAFGIGGATIRFASLGPGAALPPPIATHGFPSDLRWLPGDLFFALEEDVAGFHRLSDGRRTETLRGPGSFTSFALLAGDRVVIAPSEVDGDTIVYRRLSTPRPVDIRLPTRVHSVLWDSPRSRVVAIDLRAVYALELRNGALGPPMRLGELPGEIGLALDGAVASDGAVAVSTTLGALVLVEPGRPARAVLPPNERGTPIIAVAFDPSGRLVLQATPGDGIRRFDRDRDEAIPSLPDAGRPIIGIAFSPDGRLMATAAADGVVRLWEYGTSPHLLHELPGHEGLASHAAFSPDGASVATVDGHGSVRVFDVETGTLLRSARPHSDWINRIVWSDDGRFLATASDDGTARLLDPESLASLRIVRNSAETMRSLVTDGGEHLVTSDQDRIVLVDTTPALDRPDGATLLARAEEAAGFRLDGLDLVAP